MPRPLLQALRTWQTPAAASRSATPHTVSTWLLSPAFQGSPGAQVLLHASITCPLVLSHSLFQVFTTQVSKWLCQKGKEVIIYDLLKLPSTCRINYISTISNLFFSNLTRKYALHPLWSYWLCDESVPPTHCRTVTHGLSLSRYFSVFSSFVISTFININIFLIFQW